MLGSSKLLKRSNSIDLTREFKIQTKLEAEKAMQNELRKLLQTERNVDKREMMEKQFLSFQRLFKRYLHYAREEIDWKRIELVDDSDIKQYDDLNEVEPKDFSEYLNQLAVIKLNGGLGTSMGCTGPKSLISVRSELTFLDLTIRQLEYLNRTYHCNVPLVLMNSFNTNDDTLRVLQKYEMLNVKTYTFVQSMYPRINKESLLPLCTKILDSNFHDDEAWYPPGHGDLYRSLHNSGILDQLLELGVEWAFVSNIDNLGASVDLKILSFLVNTYSEDGPEFVMEVTEKSRADVKGGTLIRYDDQLRLLEIAQVPQSHRDEFTSVRRFNIFNTNNLWVNLSALKKRIVEGSLSMEIIVNHKTLENGINILQLEEASGAAIKSFKNAIGLRVPRSRFLPVKTTSDLLLVMSNIYIMQEDRLVMSPKRDFHVVPVVKLGSQFRKVKAFLDRFENIPDLLELDHLTVSGDVTFGHNVSLKGTVIIIANHGEIINIPSGSILENKIVSGNLRILDH